MVLRLYDLAVVIAELRCKELRILPVNDEIESLKTPLLYHERSCYMHACVRFLCKLHNI